MNAQSKIEAAPVSVLAKLREPFPDNQISKKPQETKAQIDARKGPNGRNVMVFNCAVCGGYHHKDAIHLDYVGHAAATDRLLDADERWNWEPVPDPQSLGLPIANGGMWIKLTVDGVSRYGYGSVDGKSGGDAIKEVIGDAIRNAGMRFGMALDLWHKGQLHVDEDSQGAADDKPETKPRGRGGARQQRENKPSGAADEMPDAQWSKLVQLLEATDTAAAVLLDHYKVKNLRQLDKSQYADAVGRLEENLARLAKEETNDRGGRSDIDPNDHSFN